MISQGGQQWFTCAEIAERALPGLARVKRKIQERANAECWQLKTDSQGRPLARPRQARGGGLEYNIAVLPASARIALIKMGVASDVPSIAPEPIAPQSRWRWFEAQAQSVRDEAKRRLTILDAVARLESGGCTRTLAVSSVASEYGVSTATLWNWAALVAGIGANDWLPALAPRRSGGGAEAECDPRAWQMLKSDYLRPEKPSWTSCYARAEEWATAQEIILPHHRTLWRKFEREVDARLIIAKRSGADALRGTMPYQNRSVEDLHAMEMVNIDGHRMDVFVRWPGRDKPQRPMLIVIQDIYSRKILACRVCENEDSVGTRLTFHDLFKNYGIPAHCLLDNGRAFASKAITGGAATRFRFKIKEEESTGLLTGLGIKIHWALPFRGSSKPIERAFRDLCDTTAKHPAFSGAYTGNRPDAKPENYGDAAVPLDVFQRVLDKCIAAHNAKLNRRAPHLNGRSFDAVFAESYAANPIGKASVEQLRLALLQADDSIRTHRSNGAIMLHGNRYWTPELAQIAGDKVVIRFDPDNLHSEIHVYARDGKFLVTAPIVDAVGFLDVASAKKRAKAEGDLKKAVRHAEKLEDLMSAAEIAAMLPDDPEEFEAPEPSVIRPVRHSGRSSAALKLAPDQGRPRPAPHSVIDRLSQLRLVE